MQGCEICTEFNTGISKTEARDHFDSCTNYKNAEEKTDSMNEEFLTLSLVIKPQIC